MSDLFATRPHEDNYELCVKNLSDEQLVANYRFHKDALLHDDSVLSVLGDELCLVYQFVIEEMAVRFLHSVASTQPDMELPEHGEPEPGTPDEAC